MKTQDSRVIRTQKALLAAANVLLATQNKTTVADVLEKAQVTRATFYHYYDNIDALLRAANEQRVQDLLTLAQPVINVPAFFAAVAEDANFFYAVWHENRNLAFKRLLKARLLQDGKQKIARLTTDASVQQQLFEQYMMILAMLEVVMSQWLSHDLTPEYAGLKEQFAALLRFQQSGGPLTALQLFAF